MMDAFEHLEVPQEEINEIFQIVGAVLHLGNIEFYGADSVSIANPEELHVVCELLQVDVASMESSLVWITS